MPVDPAVVISEKLRRSEIRDSGQRRDFSTGSVRDKVDGKGWFSGIPPFAELAYACILEDGAKKYSARNWEKGQPISVYLDSAQRHIAKYRAGMRDEPHLWQAFWNIGAAIFTTVRVHLGLMPAELFDLPNHVDEKEVEPLSSYEIERVNKFLGIQPPQEPGAR